MLFFPLTSPLTELPNPSQLKKKTMELIVCDEVHRTSGMTHTNEDESHFVEVHDQKFFPVKKRLHNTATPRIYGEEIQKSAKDYSVTLCPMEDPELYGEEVYRRGFAEAVKKELISNYKVLVLTLARSTGAFAVSQLILDTCRLSLPETFF
jgi:predicted helicase